jgi:O-acetyl-ADP-ribose deacetylase (regulator of RNase III)
MIKHINGDLVKDADQYEVILHGCNCFCTMGKGVALQIKLKYPEAYEVDCRTKKGSEIKLGTVSYTTNTTPIIVNCYTQFKYGAYKTGGQDLDYSAVLKCMREVKRLFSGKKIGMSKIGSSLGGGDWNITKKIIESILGDEDVTIVNYKP